MERARHRDRVVKVFQEALKRDRQRTKILHLSPLGLIEMTRKRRGESLMGILTETCPHCAGLGRVRRPLTVALKLEREAARLAAEDKIAALVIRAAPAAAGILVGDDGRRVAALEKQVGCPVYVRADYGLEIEEHEIVPATQAEAQGLVKSHQKGQELTLDRLDPPEPGAEQEVLGWAGGLRVLVDSAARVDPGAVLVIEEAARSFARAHVKGAQRKPEPRRRPGRAPREARGRDSGEVRPGQAAPAQAREAEAPPREAREREPAPLAVREAKPGAKPAGGGRRRRGRRRPRQVGAAPAPVSAPQPEKPPVKVEAPKHPQRRPRPSRRRRPAGAPRVEAQAPAAPPAPIVPAPVQAPPPRRMGLLRRGARTIARVLREE
jgi:hypothetical protein